MKGRLAISGSADHGNRAVAFTVLELLVACTILTVLLVILAQGLSRAAGILRQTNGKTEQFREARAALESITHALSEATLNTYWDYDRSDAKAMPDGYVRQSELRFISGPASALGLKGKYAGHAIFFQAPLGYVSTPSDYPGLRSLLNTCGFYLEFDSDASLRPAFLTQGIIPLRYRYRLMEFREPADSMILYNYTSGVDVSGKLNAATYKGREWYLSYFGATASAPAVPLAENIIALIIMPQLSEADRANKGFSGSSLAPDYLYDSTSDGEKSVNAYLDSRNQLPPMVQVTLVAIDEASAKRLENGDAAPDLGLDVNLFTKADDYEKDLQTLGERLTQRKINYRVFTDKVKLPAAKWSTP